MANEKLIRASEAKAKLKAFHEWFGGPVQMQGDLLARKVIEKCIEEIDKLEPVDAVEVVHGRWLTWEEKFPGVKPRRSNNLGVFCDKCHNHADNRTYFCPNCGANMKGE